MSDQDHFWKDKGTIARRSKIRDPKTWIQSGSCRNIFELKRQIGSQAVENGHTRTGYEHIQTRTSSISRRSGRSRTSTSWHSYWKYSSWTNWREIRSFDSKNFRQEGWSEIILKNAESVRSGQLFHVPLPRKPGGLPSRDYNLQPHFLGYAWFFGKRFCKSTSVFFVNLLGKCLIQGNSLLREILRCKQVRRNP